MLPPVITHSVPSIPTIITSMRPIGHCPFSSLPTGYLNIGFPVYSAGHPSSPRFPFTGDTLSIQPTIGRGFLLRLRYLKGQSYRSDLNHLDCTTVGHTNKKLPFIAGSFKKILYSVIFATRFPIFDTNSGASGNALPDGSALTA